MAALRRRGIKGEWGDAAHLVGGDGDVGGGVGDACQDEAVADLVVIQEGLVALVNTAGLDLAGAAGAGAGAAAVGKVDAGLLSGVQDVGVTCAILPFRLRCEQPHSPGRDCR